MDIKQSGFIQEKIMKITKENYEAFFIDYLEGNLDEKLVDDFIEFLQKNPKLKEELSLFEPISLEAEKINFPLKEKLYKHQFDEENAFERACVAYHEGDLNEKEKEELRLYLASHPERNKDFELFAKTKLIPDTNLIFRKKKKLYQLSVGRKVYLWSARVAAIFILVFAVFSVLKQDAELNMPEVEVAETIKSVPKDAKPEKTKEENIIPPQKEEAKSSKKPSKETVKKVIPKNKSNKKLRENSKGRIKHTDIADARIQIEVPETLKSLHAELKTAPVSFALAGMDIKTPESVNRYKEERLLADVIREKTNIDQLNIGKIKKAGLNLFSSFTKNNFSYETNDEGKIIEYSYDSRLLAFTIPSDQKADSE